MKKLTFNHLAIALFFIVGIAGVSVSHAADIKIGDVFESYSKFKFTGMYDIGANKPCGIANGTTVTVIEFDGDNILVTTNNQMNSVLSGCPKNVLLHTRPSILLSFQKQRESRDIKAASIKKMLDRLAKKAEKGE